MLGRFAILPRRLFGDPALGLRLALFFREPRALAGFLPVLVLVDLRLNAVDQSRARPALLLVFRLDQFFERVEERVAGLVSPEVRLDLDDPGVLRLGAEVARALDDPAERDGDGVAGRVVGDFRDRFVLGLEALEGLRQAGVFVL